MTGSAPSPAPGRPLYVLGISAFYHDAAAALLRDGEIAGAAQEERFTRRKHDSAFPSRAIRHLIEDAGIELGNVAAVAFYEKPFLKFERLLETYYAFAPRGVRSFMAAVPVWVREKLFLRQLIASELSALGAPRRGGPRLLFPEHHLAHAASAFLPSPFPEAAILTVDGVGEWATASIGHGRGNVIRVLRELRFPHSLGLLYSAFTHYLGFRVNSGEYKLMGLAPYGDRTSGEVARFVRLIRSRLVDLHEDGSLWMDQEYFDYAAGLTMTADGKWEALFGFPRRLPGDIIGRHHCDLAMAAQSVAEEALLSMAAAARAATGARFLCLAGGVALNGVANGKLLRSRLFEDLWVQPAAGDAGGALGAALAAHHVYFRQPRGADGRTDAMQGALLGPSFTGRDAERTARRFRAPYRRFDRPEALFDAASALLADGKIVGWFRGRMEWGPRALGNRSILADPRRPDMRGRINRAVKFREGFRPFAPAVLDEERALWFDLDRPSPYMLLVADVLESRRFPLPADFSARGMEEKVLLPLSEVPAVTHVDGSARVQTVHRGINPDFHAVLRAFRERTACGMLVNTSFNVAGEPIVCTPDDAFRCFAATEMDALVVEDLLFEKEACGEGAAEEVGGG